MEEPAHLGAVDHVVASDGGKQTAQNDSAQDCQVVDTARIDLWVDGLDVESQGPEAGAARIEVCGDSVDKAISVVGMEHMVGSHHRGAEATCGRLKDYLPDAGVQAVQGMERVELECVGDQEDESCGAQGSDKMAATVHRSSICSLAQRIR